MPESTDKPKIPVYENLYTHISSLHPEGAGRAVHRLPVTLGGEEYEVDFWRPENPIDQFNVPPTDDAFVSFRILKLHNKAAIATIYIEKSCSGRLEAFLDPPRSQVGDCVQGTMPKFNGMTAQEIVDQITAQVAGKAIDYAKLRRQRIEAMRERIGDVVNSVTISETPNKTSISRVELSIHDPNINSPNIDSDFTELIMHMLRNGGQGTANAIINRAFEYHRTSWWDESRAEDESDNEAEMRCKARMEQTINDMLESGLLKEADGRLELNIVTK